MRRSTPLVGLVLVVLLAGCSLSSALTTAASGDQSADATLSATVVTALDDFRADLAELEGVTSVAVSDSIGQPIAPGESQAVGRFASISVAVAAESVVEAVAERAHSAFDTADATGQVSLAVFFGSSDALILDVRDFTMSTAQLADDLGARTRLVNFLHAPVTLTIEPLVYADSGAAEYERMFDSAVGVQAVVDDYAGYRAFFDRADVVTTIGAFGFGAVAAPPDPRLFAVVAELHGQRLLREDAFGRGVHVYWGDGVGDQSTVFFISSTNDSAASPNQSVEWPALLLAARTVVDSGVPDVSVGSGVGSFPDYSAFHTGSCEPTREVTAADLELIRELAADGIAVTEANAGACSTAW